MLVETNISTVPDNWSNYFSQQVNSYAPSSSVDKPWRKPNKLVHIRPHKPLHNTEITVTEKTYNKHHRILPGMATFNQHKPYWVTNPNVLSPFEDDDRPDWHKFHSKNRKPMMFEEVIDENGNSRGPHGTINVRPVEPTIDESDEIDEEITL